jgi:hypothetical protein
LKANDIAITQGPVSFGQSGHIPVERPPQLRACNRTCWAGYSWYRLRLRGFSHLGR